MSGKEPMNSHRPNERASKPEDLGHFFVVRANAGDVEGLVALYAPESVLAGSDRQVLVGTEAIRRFYAELLAPQPRFEPGEQAPPLRHGDLSLTSTRLRDGAVTAEIARRQPDGRWLWIIDQPSIAR
jgi:hypothetical protein